MHPHRRADEDPPTIRPPFDPATFARDSERAFVAEEAKTDSARPTRAPPPSRGADDQGQVLVQLAVDDDDVPFLIVPGERIEAAHLSPLARAFLRHINQRDCVAVICSRAGLRADDAVVAIEELSAAGVVSFQRSTR
jgi:hypothetical protein